MQRPDPIRAVVFDFDGLLADTEKPWARAESAMFTRRGLPYGDRERAWFLGTEVSQAAALAAAHFGEDPAVIEDELRQGAVDELTKGARPMPGAVDLLRRARAAVPVAIASNTPRDLLDLAIRHSGLGGELPLVVSSSEVSRAKPAPDIYLRACQLLEVEPSQAVAFEDSRTGAAAARAAGLYLVAVPSVPGSIADADELLDSLTDPRLTSWF